SDRPQDLWPLVNGLEAGGHRVVLLESDDAREFAGPAVAVVDAVKDLTRGRDACRALRARLPQLPVIALIASDTLDALGPDWEIESFLAAGAAIPEVLARIRLAIGSVLTESCGTVRFGEISIA